MRTNKLKWVGLALAGLLLVACQNQATTNQGQTGVATVDMSRGTAAPAALPAMPTAMPTRAVVANLTLAVDGELALASPIVTAAFASSGRVKTVNVKAGQTVTQGEVLATLDDTDLQTALREAQQALALQQANIAKSEAPATQTDIASAEAALNSAYAAYAVQKGGPDAHTVQQALISWDEAKNGLYSAQLSRDQTCGIVPGSTTEEQVKQAMGNPECKRADLSVQSAELSEETAHQKYMVAQEPATQDELTQSWAAVVQAQANLDTLKGGVSAEQKRVYEIELKQAQVAVERAQRNLGQAELISPCDGVVQEVGLSEGGMSTGGSIMLLDTKQLRFETTNLTEEDAVKLKAGQAASIRLKAYGQVFTGTVSTVMPLATGSLGDLALYTALIKLSPADLTMPGVMLLPGMTGQAEISLQ